MSESNDRSEALRQAGRRAAARRAAGSGLVAVLCAGALVPVIMADPGQLGAAVAGLTGSVGGNVLTDVVSGAVAKLRGEEKRAAPLSEEAVERALTGALEMALARGGAAGAAVRALAEGLLCESRAVQAVLDGAASADPAAAAQIAGELSRLGERIGQSSTVAEGLRVAVSALEREVAQAAAERRAAVTRDRERELLLEGILDAVREPPATHLDLDVTLAAQCPYPGLAPFTREDAPVFFGRARMTRRLVREVDARARAGGLLLVLGASGAGKSSLLHAGLVPALLTSNSFISQSLTMYECLRW